MLWLTVKKLIVGSVPVSILGHRGEGASDAIFNRERDRRLRVTRFVENTLQSQRQCFRNGAVGFELDAITTADANVVTTHADEVAQHILVDYSPPAKYIGHMQTYQIREIPVGPGGAGRIPTLDDVFTMVSREYSDGLINVELKGKIGTHEDDILAGPQLAQLVQQKVQLSNFPMNQLIFSSFSHRYLVDMHAAMSDARIGILYGGCNPEEVAQFVPQPLYHQSADFQPQLDSGQTLSIASLERTLELIPSLYSVHAEISCLSAETVQWIANHNLVLATWASEEQSPSEDSEEGVRARHHLSLAMKLCNEYGICECIVITDHVRDVCKHLSQ